MKAGPFLVLTELFFTMNSVGPTGRLDKVIGRLPTDQLLRELNLLQRMLKNKNFRYYETVVRPKGYNRSMLRDGLSDVSRDMLAAGYNVEPVVNTASPVGQPFRQRIPPAMQILARDRASVAKAYMNSGRRTLMTRKEYMKVVNDEMGVFGGRIGNAIREGSAFHLSRKK